MPEFITNAGLAIIANRLKGVGNEPLYLGWGTGAGDASISSTALFTEASESRSLMVSSIVTVAVTNDSYKLVGVMIANGSKTITNWGIFDAASGGNMLLHVSKSPGDVYSAGEIGAFSFRIQFLRQS